MADRNSPEGPDRRGRLRLVTLGGASLRRVPPDGEPEELLGAGKPFAVLVYLASTPGHSATRDHLIDLLWANLDLDSARHALRQALWYLRQRVGEGALRSRDDAVDLSVPLECDRNRFLEAIETEDFARAVEVYGGEFLPVYAAPGGAEFEKWADMERYRLRTHFLRAAGIQVRDRLSRGAYDRAQELAARARDADPRNQNTWRLLLESLFAAGDRARAKIEAHALERKLDELGFEPEPPLRDLLEAAREDVGASTPTGEASDLEPELIGREREFATVLSAWSEARSGRGRHIHVVGEAGLGKSRLLAELDDRLTAMGGRSVCLRAPPGERDLGYALASNLAGALAGLPGGAEVSDGAARALVALDPDLTDRYSVEPDPAAGDEKLRRRARALEALLEAVSRREPLALLVDDLHWADAESRRLLLSLLGILEETPVLVVTTARPEAGPAGLSVEGTESLRLEPLSEEGLERLLTSLGALPDRAWAEELPPELHAATEGSPFLVLETIRLALDEGWLRLERGTWTCPDWESLQAELVEGRAVARRVEALPEEAARVLLLLLCVAARPVDAGLLAAARDAAPEPVLRRLRELEVDGLVGRAATDHWVVAHDEIAASAIEEAGEDAIREAHRCLGRALASDASGEPDDLRRAGRHLAQAADDRGQEQVFARWVSAVRDRGDRRPVDRLAADFSESARDEARVQRLVGSLPLRMRVHLTRPGIVAGTIVGLLVVAAGVFLSDDGPPPDATLYLFRPSADATVTGFQIPVRREALAGSSALDVDGTVDAVPQLTGLETQRRVLPGPSGRRWAYFRTVADSGDWEVFVADDEGSHRRLTHEPGDDVPTSWSPDGRHLVVKTSRWHRFGWQQLAVLDVETGEIRRLTEGEHRNHDARWSPDGTRIAFRREAEGDDPDDPDGGGPYLCRVTVDGAREACIDGPGYDFWLLAWRGPDAVLVLAEDSAGNSRLSLVEPETGRESVVDAAAQNAVAAPDGRWVAVLRSEVGRADRWYVYPIDRPERAAVLNGLGAIRPSRLSWGYGPDGPNPLARVEIDAPDTVPVGVPVQLEAAGQDESGRPVPVPTLTWGTDGGGGAEIDPERGVLLATEPGAIEVWASAGGWRENSLVVVAAAPPSEEIFAEDWADELDRRWVPFGDPRPRRGRHAALGRTFWASGDGTFYSGVYSRRSFDASRGLALVASVSTPRTAPAEQVLSLSLRSWDAAEAVEAWDHRTGSLPTGTASCSVKFPGGDGMHTSRWLTVAGHGRVPVGRDLGSGRPYELRLQIFPDRTCGVALDGDPIARAAVSDTTLERPYRVVLQGKSVNTEMLVGPVRVREGIPDGVDWSELEGWSARSGR